MIRIELSNEEQELLQAALSGYAADLHSEIVHTDRREFKEVLKHRRDVIEHLLDALRPAEAERPSVN